MSNSHTNMLHPLKSLKSAGPLLALILLCAGFHLVINHYHWLSLEQVALLGNTLETREYWRLLSGHFVHNNVWHLLMNLIGAVLVWLLFRPYFSLKAFCAALLLCSLGLSICLVFFSDTQWYVGLSGTLHGLFAYGLTREFASQFLSNYREHHKKHLLSTYALIIIGVAKLLYEQLGGSTQQSAELIGVSVAIDGHLYGAILGTSFAAVIMTYQAVAHSSRQY